MLVYLTKTQDASFVAFKRSHMCCEPRDAFSLLFSSHIFHPNAPVLINQKKKRDNLFLPPNTYGIIVASSPNVSIFGKQYVPNSLVGMREYDFDHLRVICVHRKNFRCGIGVLCWCYDVISSEGRESVVLEEGRGRFKKGGYIHSD